VILKQALRMTGRDWRAGELHFLLLALVVAVASLSSVGFFVDRMRAGLERDAHQLLGADLVINADQPIEPAWREQARQQGLRLADTVTFPSMAMAGTGDAMQSHLAAVKAVSPGYPLRGNMKLAEPGGGERAVDTIPAPGTAWIDPALLSALHLVRGATLQLGDRSFRVTQVISIEPDRGASFISFAPRVMLRLSDLASTNLVQPGSRLTYRLLVAGPPRTVTRFRQWIRADIARRNVRGVRIESLESGQPQMRATLDRAQRFLALVSLLSALLAAVAIAMAARRFMQRHLDACAMLRCLGLTQNRMTAMLLAEFALVGLVGSALGVLLGFGAHFVLLAWLGHLVVHELPAPGVTPALQGFAAGLLLLVGFVLPSLLQLRNVPHNRVVRRESAAPQPLTLASWLLGLAAFVALLLWQAGDLALGVLTAGGFLGGCLVFALIAWLVLYGLRHVRALSEAPAWRFALNGLQRRPGSTIVQIVALALGLMALLLLTVVRGELIDAWHRSTPPDAPNRFVINIQPDQKDAVEQRMRAGGIARPLLYPMIRGRLVQVNDTRITGKTYVEGRARRLVEREFNLSTMRALPPQNRIVAGHWFDGSGNQASVEEGLAKTLGLNLGDRLRFDVAGREVEATVTSLRKLDWSSMRVNFFVILDPAAVEGLPRTWITAFHLPERNADFGNALAREFPNLTVVDVGSIIRQLQNVIDQVVAAVEFLFLFTLASGVLVLYAALLGSQDERIREAGLLRALGATRRQLSRAQRVEFLLVGSVAGLLAASGAAAAGWTLARYVFDFEWTFNPVVWGAGIIAGALCAFVGGWAGLRAVLERPPMQTLRGA